MPTPVFEEMLMFSGKRKNWLLSAAAAMVALSAGVAGASAPAAQDANVDLAPAQPVMPGKMPADASRDWHFSTQFSFTNSYWFRYQNREPNRLNIQNTSRLTFDFHRWGSFYIESFENYAYGARRPYVSFYGDHGIGEGPAPTSNLTEIDPTIGYHYNVCSFVGVDVGWTDYITPIDGIKVSPAPGAAVVGYGSHGKVDSQEAFIRLQFNDHKLLGPLHVNPYVYVGFDYNGSYYAGAGQYYEIGIGRHFVVPNTGGLDVHPFASMSFIGSEGRLDRNLTSTRDGYLGTTVGVGTTYPLNHLLHLPAYCGSYYVGGFVDGVFTGSRYAEPTGTSRTAVLFGGDIGMQY